MVLILVLMTCQVNIYKEVKFENRKQCETQERRIEEEPSGKVKYCVAGWASARKNWDKSNCGAELRAELK